MPSHSAIPDPRLPLAILVSGGVDSAVLVGESIGRHPAVFPIYIRTGARWESVELAFLRRFLHAVASPPLQPLALLDLPVADLYGQHWSLSGDTVPDADTPDEAVYLPGRNVLLLAKGLLWCHLHDVPQLALAPLAANPFPDATPVFFSAYEAVVNHAVGGRVHLCWPYLGLTKADVLLRGRHMPLQHTLSCIDPRGGRHCGACNKCAERSRAFHDAGLHDPTDYVREVPCSA